MEKEKERLLMEGEDHDVEEVCRQRMQQFQNKLKVFHKQQEQRKAEIVARLLREEQSIQPVTPKLHHTVRSTRRGKWRKEEEEEKEEVVKTASAHTGNQSTADGPQLSLMRERDREKEEDVKETFQQAPGNCPSLLDSSPSGLLYSASRRDVMLAPEIRGLWDDSPVDTWQASVVSEVRRTQSQTGYRHHDGNSVVVKKAVSKAEEVMMQTSLKKLKESIVSKQVVAGREFKVTVCHFVGGCGEGVM